MAKISWHTPPTFAMHNNWPLVDNCVWWSKFFTIVCELLRRCTKKSLLLILCIGWSINKIIDVYEMTTSASKSENSSNSFFKDLKYFYVQSWFKFFLHDLDRRCLNNFLSSFALSASLLHKDMCFDSVEIPNPLWPLVYTSHPTIIIINT